MPGSRPLWPDWARFLQQRGLKEIAASLLEAAGPLSPIGAQLLYLGQPFIGQALPTGHLEALVHLFEDRQELKSFTAFLREE